MASPDPYELIAGVLRQAPHVVIASHVDPDGDAIGSSLGLALALDQAGVSNTILLASGDSCPMTYSFLPASDRMGEPSDLPPGYVLVSLDSPETARLGRNAPLADSAEELVTIDHHPDARAERGLALLDASSAATGVLVWRLLEPLGVVADADIATCLYTAVLTDTGRFSYSNTTPDTLRIAAEMVEAGADPNEIYTSVYENRTIGAQRLVARTLERITLANQGRVAYSWIDESDFASTGALPEEAENLIDSVRALGGVEVVLLAKVQGDGLRCSLRAKSDADVGRIAGHFGGGGHRAAAGFTYEGDLESLTHRLFPMLPGGGT